MNPVRSGLFLTKLGRDVSGNTLAIMAAAFFPLAGLIGGGVDMTRIYITKTRLQQACDAGALAGRKTMGAGAWTTAGENSSRGHAYQLFASNFRSGDFGTAGLSREFTESDGTVTGVARATVPMTIMKIFGKADHQVSVTCTAQMEIPNTDVMFVLDVTFSMAGSRMTGLRQAVNCFYEALLKVNTDQVCGGDPTATAYNGTAQIRLGFVPYAVNVNVGRLLPHDFIADSWDYQSRRANFTVVHAWSVGSPGSIGWNGWSSPPTLTSAGGYSGWSDISTGGGNAVSVNGVNRTKRPKKANGNNLSESECLALNTMGSGSMLDYVAIDDNLGSAAVDGTPTAPVHPATDQLVNYVQQHEFQVRGYRYRYVGSGDRCRLQNSSTRTYNIERKGKASRPVTWTSYDRFDSWTYKKWPVDVSGLKAGDGSTWNGTLTIPRQSTSSVTAKLSGSNSNTTFSALGPVTIPWDGCIEERATYKNTDGSPDGEFDPIPDSADDMDIDLLPTAGNQWGPLLQGAVWGRTQSGNRTTNDVTTTTVSPSFERGDAWCPNEARRLREYVTSDDTDDFEAYIDSLDPVSLGTYHDIGMIWGARLLSPTGIFAEDNEMTAEGGSIERHMIFMTDGNAQTVVDNIHAYGLPWWDRRQSTQTPTTTLLDNLVNARLSAMCTAVKNMNIKLWVISYGGGVNAANEARLSACASPGHFYSAADGPALIARFQQIASEIADLRLTE